MKRRAILNGVLTIIYIIGWMFICVHYELSILESIGLGIFAGAFWIGIDILANLIVYKHWRKPT